MDAADVGHRHAASLRADVAGSHASVWRPHHAVERALAVVRAEALEGIAEDAKVMYLRGYELTLLLSNFFEILFPLVSR